MANGTLKVSNIQTSSGSGTITLGQSGETVDFSNATTTLNSAMKATPAFEAFLSASQDVSDNTTTKIQCNSEVFDSDSCYDNSSNYRFTPTTAGKYFVYAVLGTDTISGANMDQVTLFIYKNGSSISESKIDARDNTLGSFCTVNATLTVDMNGSSDYLEAYGKIDDTSGDPDFYGGSTRRTLFGAYKIIGA